MQRFDNAEKSESTTILPFLCTFRTVIKTVMTFQNNLLVGAAQRSIWPFYSGRKKAHLISQMGFMY